MKNDEANKKNRGPLPGKTANGRAMNDLSIPHPMPDRFVIAVDGPAGSGKSTMARLVAARLGFVNIDTGAMYRAVTALMLDAGLDPADETAAETAARGMSLYFEPAEGGQKTIVNGADFTARIRRPDVDSAVSALAAHPGVRKSLVEAQRRMGGAGRVVMEGRDIGSHVFPDADVKLYLSAREETRAERRGKDLAAQGSVMALDQTLAGIKKRDQLDSQRAASPLVKPQGAFEIDTSDLTIDEALAKMLEIILFKIVTRSGGPGKSSEERTDNIRMTASQKGAIRRVRDEDYANSVAEADLGETALAGSHSEYEDLVNVSMQSCKEGQLVTGVVISRTPSHIIVDVGFKSEGRIAIGEFGSHGPALKVGDKVDVLLESSEDAEGQVILSKDKANKIKVWDEIAKVYESDSVIEGVITSKIKGGLTVDIGLKAFLPGSQIDLRPIKNLDRLIGERHKFRIIKMNKKRGNIVLSRRVLLEEERKISKGNALSQLEDGKVVEGVVKNITDYGAFIDLGGIDGLLHITDMSWGRVNHPSEMFSIGDTVKVMVLKFDRVTERVSLGLKQTTPDPWANAESKYKPNTRVSGKIVSIADYGAFIELEEGIEGLVHISEMTWNKHIRHPGKLVNIGDQVEAVVLSLDREKKRISLGMKQIEANPWETIEERYPTGAIIEGRVRNLADFGAFVELEDGVDGLIHISDMSWTQKVKHPSELLKKRDKVRCIVLSVDKENERLSLGLKQLEKDPWDGVESRFPIGSEVKCAITKVANFGAFAELESGIEGLIHVSQLSTNRIANPRKAVKVGQEVTAKVIKLDAANRRIGLSIKAFLEGLSPEEVERELRAMEEAAASSEESEQAGDDGAAAGGSDKTPGEAAGEEAMGGKEG